MFLNILANQVYMYKKCSMLYHLSHSERERELTPTLMLDCINHCVSLMLCFLRTRCIAEEVMHVFVVACASKEPLTLGLSFAAYLCNF